MKFSRIIFAIAGIWGFLILTPLYFLLDRIGRMDPPPITHSGFYYGFVAVALAWQIAFLIIAADPVRLRPLMIAAMLEKFGYAATFIALYLQSSLTKGDLALGCIDLVFGMLFLVAYFKVRSPAGIA
jgi:hypothetical protein